MVRIVGEPETRGVGFASVTEKINTARSWLGRRKEKRDDKQRTEIRALLNGLNVNGTAAAGLYKVSKTTIYKHVGPRVPTRTEGV